MEAGVAVKVVKFLEVVAEEIFEVALGKTEVVVVFFEPFAVRESTGSESFGGGLAVVDFFPVEVRAIAELFF